MSVSLKCISTGATLLFPSMPDGSVDVTKQSNYQKFDILNKGEIAHPTGPHATEYKWSGMFFGEGRMGTPLITNWKSPQAVINTLNGWYENGDALNLIVSDTGINDDVTISKFVYSPTGGYGDFKYTIELLAYGESKIDSGSGDVQRNSKPKKKVYTVPNNYTSRSGICKISELYYGTTSKWKKIYDKNKKKIEAAAKKHGRKNSDKGKYLYKGTKLTIP